MAQYSSEINTMLFRTLARLYRLQTSGEIMRCVVALDFIDMAVLVLLHDSAKSIKSLCEITGFDRNEITKSIRKIINADLAKKSKDVDDRRMAMLRLTEKGEKCSCQVVDQIKGPLDVASAKLSLNEEKATLKYLTRLHQAIKLLE